MTINLIDVKNGIGLIASEPMAAGHRTSVELETTAAIQRMFQYAGLTDLPLTCIDANTGTVLAKTEPESINFLPAEIGRQLAGVTVPRTFDPLEGLLFYAIPLPEIDQSKTVAVGFVFSQADVRSPDLVFAAAEENWSQSRLEEWTAKQPLCNSRHVQALLKLAASQLESVTAERTLHGEIDQLTEQIEQTYEEIALLHNLTQNLQISRSPAELAKLCLNRMHASIRSAGSVIWIEDKKGAPRWLVKGEIPFDEVGMARLIARFEDHDWHCPIVRNNVERSLMGADFPGLKSVVIVPIAEGSHRAGWIISCNPLDGRELGTIEASLLNSIATILGTHVRNIDLYRQHDDLLLSFVRSLVSTLDARDPYTRGHSDRVALIARRLGEQMSLPEDDLHSIYRSGLLHDVGKIGIDDRILRKPGKLTTEEYQEIQKHPMIGYRILNGLKNLQDVLPGVRNHHETYNGRGYPDGLRGEEIPLMARILAVADSYDAMGSDRPYRKGLPTEKIEEIFLRGAGEQWDARVVEAYFEARDDIARLCECYSPGNGDLLESAEI